MHARLRLPNNLLILDEIKIEPDFLCLAGKIAEPCPDMNIKVAAFTVSEKSINKMRLHLETATGLGVFKSSILFSYEYACTCH